MAEERGKTEDGSLDTDEKLRVDDK